MEERKDLDISLFSENITKFNHHLMVEGNKHIIFSGKFGIGKTTFLNEFFDLENQKKRYDNSVKYNVSYLTPVNYSIASNEDIFKYIKYDILLELLAGGASLEDDVFNTVDALPIYLINNFDKVIFPILSIIPIIGKDLSESLEKLYKLKKDFEKDHKKNAERLNENSAMLAFFEKIHQSEGSLYENDATSLIIEKLIKQQKSKNAQSESVLIIDDLDRIDPEHIFRILNVFSTHFDRYNKGSKFSFDKVIVACDIKNIRSIFRAKYGINTDFNGYIDKFYSHRIYEFDIKIELKNIIKSIIRDADWGRHEYGKYDNTVDAHRGYLDDGMPFLYDILYILIENGQLPLRNILKLKRHPIHLITHLQINGQKFYTPDYPVIMMIKILIQLKGNAIALKDALQECVNIYLSSKDSVQHHAVELVKVSRHNRFEQSSTSFTFIIGSTEYTLHRGDNNPSISGVVQKSDFIQLFSEVIDLIDNAVIQY